MNAQARLRVLKVTTGHWQAIRENTLTRQACLLIIEQTPARQFIHDLFNDIIDTLYIGFDQDFRVGWFFIG